MHNDSFVDLLLQADANPPKGEIIGHSRQSRPIFGYRFGRGELKISLVAGAHADEPIGTLLLKKLVTAFSSFKEAKYLLDLAQWFLVPDANPDGAEKNRAWQDSVSDAYDLRSYLQHAVREEPGDDIEFGYPLDASDTQCRPENLAIYNWWKEYQPFDIHGSLHGMGIATGPWFLLDNSWAEQSLPLVEQCQQIVLQKGFLLHDIDRHGEKGFYRIAKGFSSCPDSKSMQAYFLKLKDPTTAALFRPSSMETIKSFSPNALTFATEIPLFIVTAERNKPIDQLMSEVKAQLRKTHLAHLPIKEAFPHNIKPMKITDQLFFQWYYVSQCVALLLQNRQTN